ncbi:hypothetical protein BDY17DRAFT_163698 [Neohortaea acidophila]|uniref:RRM domain-containing protein n=1 Tax=Neohortaea acidophila TaxID=245834 RepID=A0A6A6PSI9_9PEZI|nr:uncharacterized protein BDY17DRAFT_163698 [Neohortaea acidophila]KAF2482651.1 hypothetical protein BDY17DRAFT_163698 [Neohortaea acidophila]
MQSRSFPTRSQHHTMSGTEEESMVDSTTPKRKRAVVDEELEIDLNLPEPASKKAKRKEKKAKLQPQPQPSTTTEPTAPDEDASEDRVAPAATPATTQSSSTNAQASDKRSEYGIWIGNLPFTVTKERLREFLDEGGIEGTEITRLHMPTSAPQGKEKGAAAKAQNKGFAYVDFATKVVLDKALELSEKLLNGRRVLIKNAKSFEGRPAKTDAQKEGDAPGNAKGLEPTKRVFVGNLGFDVTREELSEHFTQAGEIEDIFLATFEDSGKCKGFGWLRFATIEAAQAAVKGFIFKGIEGDADEEEDEDDSADESKKTTKRRKRKPQKWFINRLNGRQLRCEFAEDAQTRYKKRFGKEARAQKNDDGFATDGDAIVPVDGDSAQPRARPHSASNGQQKSLRPQTGRGKPDSEERREDRRKRHEKMNARATATTQASSGGIVEAQGKKMVFDD